MNGFLSVFSLIKMVYNIAAEQKREPQWPELEHAIRRNFGGLDLTSNQHPDQDQDPVKIFQQYFPEGRLQRVRHESNIFWDTVL